MKVVCSYCHKELGEKPPLDDPMISHSMCEECLDYYTEMWAGLSLDQYLNRFELPVLAVNDEGRIVALNDLAEMALGKHKQEVFGLLGGEVMECEYARLEGGCGNTVHCLACSIRQTVMKVMETGEPQENVQAYLNRVDVKYNLLISAVKRKKIVTLSIHSMTPSTKKKCSSF